jgi:hypothetical protein
MVDVIRSLGIEYIAANPASSFRGLQESIVNYGGNAKPEFLTCMHEESSIGMAHGYQGKGGGAGPRIAPDPLPFDGLAAFVRTTSGEMPPYTTTLLSDNDLADIYAYLQSIPRPPALADVPLLKQ